MRVDEEAARSQIERLDRLRRERDNAQTQAALDRLAEVARGDSNAVPAILDCVESYCTLGEISEVLRNVFGEQKRWLPSRRQPMPDLLLNEEEQMLQTTLREFVDREIAPKAKESDERAEFQWAAWKGMAALGLTGLGVDVKHGGSGPAGYRQISIAAEEVARGDASASVSWLAPSGPGCGLHRPHRQRRPEGTPVADVGQRKGSGRLRAHRTRRRVRRRRLQTTATERDGTYFLNGSKMFITNASVAQSIVVFATQDRSAGYKGISAFVVQKDSPGLTINPMHGKLGMRSSTTDEIVFQERSRPRRKPLGRRAPGLQPSHGNSHLQPYHHRRSKCGA